MITVVWPCAADGRYWLDITLGNSDCRLMLDAGIIDPLDQIGVELDPAAYDPLKSIRPVPQFPLSLSPGRE